MPLIIFTTDIRADLGKRQLHYVFEEIATRQHLIPWQDCRIACRKVCHFSNHRHNNDAISLGRIVKELKLEDPSTVIDYKP